MLLKNLINVCMFVKSALIEDGGQSLEASLLSKHFAINEGLKHIKRYILTWEKVLCLLVFLFASPGYFFII